MDSWRGSQIKENSDKPFVVHYVLSPHIRKYKTVLDSGSHSMDSGFHRVLDSSLFQWNVDSGFHFLVGFRSTWALFWIPKPWIPDSTSKKFPDSGICTHLTRINLGGLRSRRLEVVGQRENGRARGRHARGEEAPAQKAPENRFNSHAVSADISNWSRAPEGKSYLTGRGNCQSMVHGQRSEHLILHH